jgi:DNA-binding transcriptional ArsR family regulator
MGTPDSGGKRPPSSPIVSALGHPLRAKLLFTLNDTPDRSAQEMAELVGAPVRTVRHHLSEMRKAGLIESVEQQTRRGVVEHFYRLAVAPPAVAEAEFTKLTGSEKLRIVTQALKHSYEVAAEAMGAGTLYARADYGIVTVLAELDSQGWRELVEAQRNARDEVERVKRHSAERLRGGEEEPIRAASALMWFELPAR